MDELSAGFNREFDASRSARLLAQLEQASGTAIGFPVAGTPVFFPRSLLHSMAEAGAQMAVALIDSGDDLEAAHAALPQAWRVPGETPHPNFIAADFTLVEGEGGTPVPRLLEIQGCASSYAFQAVLCEAYRNVFATVPRPFLCSYPGMTFVPS
jgi:hypothetical protein